MRLGMRIFLVVSVVASLAINQPAIAQSKSLVGTVCKHVGAKTKAGDKNLVCSKQGKKAIWKVLPKTNKPATQNGGSTQVNSPCTKVGEVVGNGPGSSLICQSKDGKSIWQILSPDNASQTDTSNQSPMPTSTTSPTSSCTKAPEFTENFIDPKYVRVVTPIGEQTGSGGVIAVRSYIHPSNDFLGQELPIYAPVDMTLNSASYYKLAEASVTYQPEYSLYFDAGCGISIKFFHIKGVVGKIAGAVPTSPSPSSAGQPVPLTAVKAGDQIGWYKLGENSVAFDFWVDDASHTNDFIVPSHFGSSNALHSVCPYDFYSADKKAIWLGKLGGPGGNPVQGTSCGVVNEGISGTADGMWFINQNTITDQLAIDGSYQSQIMFSVDADGIVRIGGLNTSSTLNQMMVDPQSPTWIRPADVKVGSSHCWSNSTQSVSVNVKSATTMSVVVGTGSCASLSNASSGRMYYR